MVEKQTIDIIVLKDNEARLPSRMSWAIPSACWKTPIQENTAEVLKTLSDLNPTSKAYASVPQPGGRSV